MPSGDPLTALPVEELRAELAHREAVPGSVKRLDGGPPVAAGDRYRPLAAFPSSTIVTALLGRQKAIYGDDDRAEVRDVAGSAPGASASARGVCALVRTDRLTEQDGGALYRSSPVTLQQRLRTCSDVAFAQQPSLAFGTGFLVGPDIVATAAHCARAGELADTRAVFDFVAGDGGRWPGVVAREQVYEVRSVIAERESSDGADWALLRLDRTVAGREPLRIREAGRVAAGRPLYVVGHPSGLPMKIAARATVRDNPVGPWFSADLDTFGGSSGSPVFDADTGVVEGILVRGETDWVTVDGCAVPLVCPTTGCRGEECTRSTEFASRLRAARRS